MMMDLQEVEVSVVQFKTDRAILTGSLYRPKVLGNASGKNAVLIGSATGIKRHFYHHFAQFLAQRGVGVLTFDYEGIGDSLVGRIEDCSASLVTWGQCDLAAALDCLVAQFGDCRYHLVGHSAGGQLFGLMANHSVLSSVFCVGSSSGSLKNFEMPYWSKAQFFMNVFIPLNNGILGFTRSAWVGMGEDLPKGVASDWREWCNGSGYAKMAFGKSIQTQFYDQVRMPSLWVFAVDDDIANEKNVYDLLSVYANLPATVKKLVPADYGLNHIGHMKFFSRQSRVLWDLALDWILYQKAK